MYSKKHAKWPPQPAISPAAACRHSRWHDTTHGGHCTLCRHTHHCTLYLSVCLCASVCLSESVLWQNGCVDPDAVWDREWGQSNDGSIRWVVIIEGEGAVLMVNLWHPAVTNGDNAE